MFALSFCRIVPVSGLTLAPWWLNQVAGRSSGQDPHATLDVYEAFASFSLDAPTNQQVSENSEKLKWADLTLNATIG